MGSSDVSSRAACTSSSATSVVNGRTTDRDEKGNTAHIGSPLAAWAKATLMRRAGRPPWPANANRAGTPGSAVIVISSLIANGSSPVQHRGSDHMEHPRED